MLNTNYQSNFSYPQMNCSFGSKPRVLGSLKKQLQSFAPNVNLANDAELAITKELFSSSEIKDLDNYKFIKGIKLKVVKPEKGVLPAANYRALELSVDFKKGYEESNSSVWLKTGTVPEIQDYLRQNPTEVAISEKVKSATKEAFQRD